MHNYEKVSEVAVERRNPGKLCRCAEVIAFRIHWRASAGHMYASGKNVVYVTKEYGQQATMAIYRG
jgi:hypothetical protein